MQNCAIDSVDVELPFYMQMIHELFFFLIFFFVGGIVVGRSMSDKIVTGAWQMSRLWILRD